MYPLQQSGLVNDNPQSVILATCLIRVRRTGKASSYTSEVGAYEYVRTKSIVLFAPVAHGEL